MLKADKTELGRKAAELGFNRDSYEKMIRLTEVLQFINTNKELNPLLALKGRTAINLTVFNLPRLSVDIDLNFSENLTRDDTMEKRNYLNELIGRYMKDEGYTIKEEASKRTHALYSFVFSYKNAGGNRDNVKVETNYMLRCHVLSVIDCMTNASDAFLPFRVRTLSPEEIFAGKINALTGRAAIRDLYDTNNMVNEGVFDETGLEMLRKCTVFYLVLSGESGSLSFSLSKISELVFRDVKTDLLPMTRKTERFDLEAAKKNVTSFLSELLKLPENETAFLKRFAKGRYEPQLLFDDKDILDRIKNHPMAIWRTQRIRERQQER